MQWSQRLTLPTNQKSSRMLYWYNLLAFAGYSCALARTDGVHVMTASQNLRDPRIPFLSLDKISIPAPSWPILQSSFLTQPDCGESSYHGTNRLAGRRALITGGDSGIGRAISIAFAREGARIAIAYLPGEEADARALSDFLSQEGLEVEKIPGDLMNETFCADVVHRAHAALGGLDLVVNNAGCVPLDEHGKRD